VSPVQHRDRQQVEDGQVDADEGDHVEELPGAGLHRVGHDLDDAYRAGEAAGGDAPRHEAPQREVHLPDVRRHPRERVPVEVGEEAVLPELLEDEGDLLCLTGKPLGIRTTNFNELLDPGIRSLLVKLFQPLLHKQKDVSPLQSHTGNQDSIFGKRTGKGVVLLYLQGGRNEKEGISRGMAKVSY